MQIRVANRQDEPLIRAIVNDALLEAGQAAIDLKGRDQDLNNVDAHYFWYDGICIVAEEEGQIIGLAGARRGRPEESLELLRLVVVPQCRKQGVAHKLFDTVLFFARNAEYKQICYDAPRQDESGYLVRLGFKLADLKQGDDRQDRWILALG